jgi:integral membrane sensor domain MASE1
MVSEVRRSKRMRRFRVVTVSVLVIVLSSALMGLLAESPNKWPKETALVAAHESAAKEKVSPWMLIGFFKECFKRNRTNKRKEEY